MNLGIEKATGILSKILGRDKKDARKWNELRRWLIALDLPIGYWHGYSYDQISDWSAKHGYAYPDRIFAAAENDLLPEMSSFDGAPTASDYKEIQKKINKQILQLKFLYSAGGKHSAVARLVESVYLDLNTLNNNSPVVSRRRSIGKAWPVLRICYDFRIHGEYMPFFWRARILADLIQAILEADPEYNFSGPMRGYKQLKEALISS